MNQPLNLRLKKFLKFPKKPLVKSFVAKGLGVDRTFGVFEAEWSCCWSLTLVDEVPNKDGDPHDVLIEPLVCENLAGVFWSSGS